MNPESIKNRTNALSIAAGVFAQLSNTRTVVPEGGGAAYQYPIPRGLEEFCKTVDVVFKSIGLEAVAWGEHTVLEAP